MELAAADAFSMTSGEEPTDVPPGAAGGRRAGTTPPHHTWFAPLPGRLSPPRPAPPHPTPGHDAMGPMVVAGKHPASPPPQLGTLPTFGGQAENDREGSVDHLRAVTFTLLLLR